VGSISRDKKLLKTELQEKLLKVQEDMAALGHPIFLVEGYRSPERQAELYKAKVSPAKRSRHTDREAGDLAFEGESPYSEEHPWDMLGTVAEAHGLEWGGRWKTRDRTHVQLKRKNTPSEAR
jgi:peptidoglycan L-alanyl-D-glutamate endopeptidase CwlK